MSAFYKELQPSNSFNVRLPYPFSDYDRQLLILLYQPMIGAEAISLYLTLWAEGEGAQEETTHYILMNNLGMSIEKIFESRIQLEAIGLMKSLLKEEEEVRSFIYELYPPLEPEIFFSDVLLSMFLFNKVGEYHYRRLLSRFSLNKGTKKGYKDVSRAFTEVYKPTHSKPNYPAKQEELENRKRIMYQLDTDFDFQLLRTGLSENLFPTRLLTVEIKEAISKIAFLYGYSPVDMQKILLIATNAEDNLTVDILKKTAVDFYKLAISSTAPEIIQIKNIEKPKPDRFNTKQEKIKYDMETIAPIEMLRQHSYGKEPLPADIYLVNDLILKHDIPHPVVNVLIDYVMLINDKKLTRSYVERIAAQWNRKNILTVDEAMELARSEHDKYIKWKTESSNSMSKNNFSSTKKVIREEKLPEWFNQKEEDLPVQNQKQMEELEIEKQKLLSELALKKRRG